VVRALEGLAARHGQRFEPCAAVNGRAEDDHQPVADVDARVTDL